MKLYDDLQKYHNYTDYQIKLVQYALKSIFSEISKFGILVVFFLLIGKLPEFLLAALPLLFFRRYNGGLHCNTYLTCLLASFLFFFVGIVILPSWISVPFAVGLVLMAAMTVLIPLIAPVKSKYHAEVEPARIRKYKLWTLAVMAGLTLLYWKLPQNPYMINGFWIVMLHAIQLSVAYIKKRRCEK